MRWLVDRVFSCKEKKVEMPIIRTIKNDESVGDNFEDKEKKFLKDDDKKNFLWN